MTEILRLQIEDDPEIETDAPMSSYSEHHCGGGGGGGSEVEL